jgi:hypothetical protein
MKSMETIASRLCSPVYGGAVTRSVTEGGRMPREGCARGKSAPPQSLRDSSPAKRGSKGSLTWPS